MTILDEKLKEFDGQFGTDGPDKNSDSIGRGAGCDDCWENIKLRAEHKSFLTSFYKEMIESDIEVMEGMKKQRTSDRQLYRFDGTVEQIKYFENDGDPKYNQAIDDLISLKKQLLSITNIK